MTTTEVAIEAPEAPSAGERLTGRALEVAACRAAGYRLQRIPMGGFLLWEPVGETWTLADSCKLPPDATEEEGWQECAPHYLTDPAAAMGLMDTAVEMGAYVSVSAVRLPRGRPVRFTALINREHRADGDTFGEALCRAFLAAHEAEANR
jgi:hypothetical protein